MGASDINAQMVCIEDWPLGGAEDSFCGWGMVGEEMKRGATAGIQVGLGGKFLERGRMRSRPWCGGLFQLARVAKPRIRWCQRSGRHRLPGMEQVVDWHC